jgi:hypothetical protein
VAVCHAFGHAIIATLNSHGASGETIAGGLFLLLIILLFVPFCLLISQNKFESDENSGKKEEQCR